MGFVRLSRTGVQVVTSTTIEMICRPLGTVKAGYCDYLARRLVHAEPTFPTATRAVSSTLYHLREQQEESASSPKCDLLQDAPREITDVDDATRSHFLRMFRGLIRKIAAQRAKSRTKVRATGIRHQCGPFARYLMTRTFSIVTRPSSTISSMWGNSASIFSSASTISITTGRS